MALLADIDLEFVPGLNVVTGETGAGKSLLLEALMLACGSSSRLGRLEGRTGMKGKAEVTADFSGVELRCELTRRGRPRFWCQGQAVARSEVGEVVQQLVEWCGQNAQHRLVLPSEQLRVVDERAGLGEVLSEYQRCFSRLTALNHELARLKLTPEEVERRQAALTAELAELRALDLLPGEAAELSERQRLLGQARQISEWAEESQQVLRYADDSVCERLSRLRAQLTRRIPESELATSVAETFDQALGSAEAAAEAAARLALAVEAEPGELERTEARLRAIQELCYRRRCEPESLPAEVERLARELDELLELDVVTAELEAARSQVESECVALAEDLHRRRELAARVLVEAVEQQLKQLHMPDCRFGVLLARQPKLGASGVTRCQFTLAPNPGVPAGPLSNVASGGEMSRLLLALRSSGLHRRQNSSPARSTEPALTLVFDEIDAGVSGVVAHALGRAVRNTSLTHQVICVTHLPQVAACADAHFFVQKSNDGRRTVSQVRLVRDAARTQALANMLGAESPGALEYARQLLDAAELARCETQVASRRMRRARPRVTKSTVVAAEPAPPRTQRSYG